jgi:hypothetical protein
MREAHAHAIQIKHRLTPIIVAMAGADLFDRSRMNRRAARTR